MAGVIHRATRRTLAGVRGVVSPKRQSREGGLVRRSFSGGGFSLIEVMLSMGILTVGVLGLAGVMALAMRNVGASSATLIAREKAREAVESVHTARDNGTLLWDQVRNAPNGVFVATETELYRAGADGLVNTADDVAAGVEVLPGFDGIFDTDDDVPLTDFRRQIAISDLMHDGTTTVNRSLREVTVTIRYRVQGAWRTYTLRTYVAEQA